MSKMNVGIIGCGNISGIYCKAGKRFANWRVLACADLDVARAKAKAAEFEIPIACSTGELLRNPEIEMVINLTVPKAHAEITLAAIEHGKHVYGEKPLATTRQAGRRILEAAQAKGVRVGSAPDTFLGGGLQTCRKLIDDGWIGHPVAATAFMTSHGCESWHPDPDFFYQPGGGPMFDMGPYYLTALVNLVGPIHRVCGSAGAAFTERRITSQAKFGTMIKVHTPTHIAGVLDFASGAIGTIITSFDVWAANLPRIEIYGTTGTLLVPDPNTFGGPVQVRRAGASEWSTVPLAFGYQDNSRGLGCADMISAIAHHRPHRASGDLAYHVLDVMEGFLDAARAAAYVKTPTALTRPAPLPMDLRDGEID